MPKLSISLILSLIAAIILLQTLFFKFTAHPDSVYIFTQLGMEPYGRIGIGVAELITAILLIVPSTRPYGAVIGLGVISGALFFHLTKLGVNVNNDGGKLFGLALATFVCCLGVVFLERKKLPILNKL
ncbi:MAG TPA: DoxX family protein [Haliscomenobacter sp.]|uniref:DoxX family protein n=1 Tax=Haliscomenobacter sp. TaxID=2717303 RepID=UPI002C0AB9A9|nr:DoxX family protein [Haliscomenobacter sp.]HOY16452.1 DoxX family protein [Haliscomenobacter sp.]